uniref:Inositol polyphosphate 1-phosphatase-like n=1 Tax=Hirondellea gigas TaxID=1518452 RepID=A0A2P2I6V9_9CRUS
MAGFRKLAQMLLDFSEQAAELARTIRADDGLFQLLVEEKTGEQKNTRFARDFKTLADVLIQQTLCHKVEKEFPELTGRVFGEECAVFSNVVGETITVTVQETEHQTAQLLTKILDGNVNAANTLAQVVHRTDISANKKLPDVLPEIPLDHVAIWIDPIDSTAEYIFGDTEGSENLSSKISGLPCVTVLIGVFLVHNGAPVLGIINQPFLHLAPRDSSKGRRLYESGGAYIGVTQFCSGGVHSTEASGEVAPLQQVMISSSERLDVQERLSGAGIKCVEAAGAGYKCLAVITQQAQLYICSKGSTYMWDTCAPHSILLSNGGGIIPFTSLKYFATESPPDHLKYQTLYTHPSLQSVAADSGVAAGTAAADTDVADTGDHAPSTDTSNEATKSSIAPFCNSQGIVAYQNVEHLYKIAKILV